ncbi:MAG TPA: oxalurate catabolism protein HpxZ [Acidimicrobiales bacterium]|nr:oxalurate catabolism protein HpxZ [Acidimicrobiales bacterium]
MEIGIPSVVAEVTEALQAYERALQTDDLAAPDNAFWDSASVVRIGIAENLYGAEAIARYRRTTPPRTRARSLSNTVIVTFGHDCAAVSSEFSGPVATAGRQTQVWARLPAGWKVVAAHVSLIVR